MNEFPPLRILSRQDMEGCTQGECCNCGMCCTAFEIRVPTYPYEAGDTSMIQKASGVPCPHLVTNSLGQELCGIHEHKETDPRLLVCRNWSGKGEGSPDLAVAIGECITEPKTADDVDRYRQWLIAGKLSHLSGVFNDHVNLLMCIDNYVVRLGMVPHDLFEALGLKAACAAYDTEQFLNLLVYSEIDRNNASHREFLAAYAPHAL